MTVADNGYVTRSVNKFSVINLPIIVIVRILAALIICIFSTDFFDYYFTIEITLPTPFFIIPPLIGFIFIDIVYASEYIYKVDFKCDYTTKSGLRALFSRRTVKLFLPAPETVNIRVTDIMPDVPSSILSWFALASGCIFMGAVYRSFVAGVYLQVLPLLFAGIFFLLYGFSVYYSYGRFLEILPKTTGSQGIRIKISPYTSAILKKKFEVIGYTPQFVRGSVNSGRFIPGSFYFSILFIVSFFTGLFGYQFVDVFALYFLLLFLQRWRMRFKNDRHRLFVILPPYLFGLNEIGWKVFFISGILWRDPSFLASTVFYLFISGLFYVSGIYLYVMELRSIDIKCPLPYVLLYIVLITAATGFLTGYGILRPGLTVLSFPQPI